MDKVQVKMNIFYDDGFYRCVIEKIIDKRLFVSKYTFGAEPSEKDINDFFMYKYDNLQFIEVTDSNYTEKIVNPKRMKRLVKKQICNIVGTKSQNALKLQYELSKKVVKKKQKEKRDEKENYKYSLKKNKKILKHKGK